MIVFFGTSSHSAYFLDLAIKNGLKVDQIVSAPPKKIGRNQILTENPIVSFAKQNNIPYTVILIRQLAEKNLLKQLKKEDPSSRYRVTQDDYSLGLILDFNQIIPQNTIDLFNKGIINIHFSKLPQYRGASPVQYTILNGDKEAWISYFLINEKMDEGTVLKQTSLLLDGKENTETLYQKLVEKASKEVQGIINEYLEGKITPKPQKGDISLAKKLTTKDFKIDWEKTPEEIERLVRAAYPEPGAWTEIKLKVQSEKLKVLRLKVLKAHLENSKLILDQVQLEGKKPVTWQQFVQGHPKAEIKQT